MSIFHGLGKALRWLRTQRDKKQYEIADGAGITKAMLSGYETGRQRPSLDTLEKILEALDADLRDLVEALEFVRRPPGVGSGGVSGRRFYAFSERPFRASAELADAPGEIERLLGLDGPIPAEEAVALGEITRGIHRLLRVIHERVAAIHSPDRNLDD